MGHLLVVLCSQLTRSSSSPVPPLYPTKNAIVQFTHTARAARSIVLARQQVRRWQQSHANLAVSRGVQFHHHVIGWADYESGCTNLTAALALPFTENVSCTSSPQLVREFAAFVPVLGMDGPHTHSTRSGSYGAHKNRNLAWNNCDGPSLYWFSVHRRERYDYYWLVEWGESRRRQHATLLTILLQPCQTRYAHKQHARSVSRCSDVFWSDSLPRMLAGYHGVPFDPTDLASPPSACEMFPDENCELKRKDTDIEWPARDDDLIGNGGSSRVSPSSSAMPSCATHFSFHAE